MVLAGEAFQHGPAAQEETGGGAAAGAVGGAPPLRDDHPGKLWEVGASRRTSGGWGPPAEASLWLGRASRRTSRGWGPAGRGEPMARSCEPQDVAGLGPRRPRGSVEHGTIEA